MTAELPQSLTQAQYLGPFTTVLSKLHLVAISESVSMRMTRSEAACAKGKRLPPKTPAMSPAANAVDATTPNVIFMTNTPVPVVAKCRDAFRQNTPDEACGASGWVRVRRMHTTLLQWRDTRNDYSGGKMMS